MLPEKLLTYVIEKKLKKFRKGLLSKDPKKVLKTLKGSKPEFSSILTKYRAFEILNHSTRNSPFYKKVIPKISKQITYKNGLDVLKQLPLITQKDVSEDPEQFLAIPKEDIAAYHFTSGTTGKRKKIYLSSWDLETIQMMYSIGFLNLGVEKGDIAQIMYSFGLWQLGGLIQQSLRRFNVVCLPTSNSLSYQEQEEFIREFGTTIIAGTPAYIYNLARESDLKKKEKERMKFIYLGGEAVPKLRRQRIEDNLGGEVIVNYGLMEMGGGVGSECKLHQGYHIATNIYPEVIDPKTGEQAEPEEYGELVLSGLVRKAMPLLRYRTGDITRLLEGECDCGLPLPMIDYITGRTDDRVTIGTAEKYYPIVFDELFDTVEDIKDYWIEVHRTNGKDLLKVFIVTKKASEKLKQMIMDKFYSITSIKTDINQTETVDEPEIIFIDNTKLEKEKRRRLVDKRKE